MIVTVEKNKKTYQHYVGLGYNESIKTYRAVAFNKNREELGYISFRTMNEAPSYIWLYKIYVKPEYRGQAVGTALLNVLEAFCTKMEKTRIMAEFNPEDDENEEQYKLSEEFYKKNGFSFSVAGLKEYVTKDVSPTDETYLFKKIRGYRVLQLKDSSERTKIADEVAVM